MSLQVVVVVLALLYLGTCSAQTSATSRGDNATVPLTYRAKSVEGSEEEVCGPERLRQRLQTKTRDGIVDLLRDNLQNLAPCEDKMLGQIEHCPAASCQQMDDQSPVLRPSGYYWIRSSNGSSIQVYCDLERVCGCRGGEGWMRVAYLNVNDTSQQCPGDWREITNPIRTCGRREDCSSAFFPTYGIRYTRVCGKLVGYQLGATGAFGRATVNTTINDDYVDGISVTHGSPRQHIWTFASAISESRISTDTCPCAHTGTIFVPEFVGQNYFCEAGTDRAEHSVLYSDDPLWDGQGCGTGNMCCEFNNPPWFCRQLPEATTDDIEVRICSDAAYIYEDVPLEWVELYVL